MAEDRVTGEKQRVTFTWEDDPNQVITFDATPNENHSSNAEPTDHPIEAGSDASDHIRKLPDELGLLGVVTDTPLQKSGNPIEPASTGGDVNQRAISAYDFLYLTQDRGKLVRIFTKLRDYRNMSITALNITRDKDTSRIINGKIQLREIKIAVTEQVEAPTPAASAAPSRRRKRKQGKKSKQKETEANKGKSKTVALRLADKAGALDLGSLLSAP